MKKTNMIQLMLASALLALGPSAARAQTSQDGPYAYLNKGSYLSSNPGRGEGGVALTFHESVRAR
jgi:hypothetical protein